MFKHLRSRYLKFSFEFFMSKMITPNKDKITLKNILGVHRLLTNNQTMDKWIFILVNHASITLTLITVIVFFTNKYI